MKATQETGWLINGILLKAPDTTINDKARCACMPFNAHSDHGIRREIAGLDERCQASEKLQSGSASRRNVNACE